MSPRVNMNCVFGGKTFISIVILLGYVTIVRGKTKHDSGHLSERLINDLYQKYKEAVSNDADIVILRRLFDHNRLFEIHIKKLKEVNGLKQHNLMIKGNPRSGNNPFIYINNPVESKLPNAYLTLEEFKEALTKRVEKQREKLTTKARRIEYLDVDKMKRAYTKKVPRTTYEDSLQTLLYDKGNDIDKFLKSLYSAPEKDIMLRASDTKVTKKSKKKTLVTTESSILTSEDNSNAITETVKDRIEDALQIEIIDEATTNSDNTNQEKSTKPVPLKNEEFIYYRPAVDDIDSTVRTSIGMEAEVTTTSLVDFPRSEVRSNREAVQPNNYMTTNLKGALNKTDNDINDQIPKISTSNNPKTIQVNENEERDSTTVFPKRETPKLHRYYPCLDGRNMKIKIKTGDYPIPPIESASISA
ncbi:uncharacterized protein LOC123701551 [Colias croceus]|uniref:uncharacterized protein LOC123701551 n=1 Tax=Colias crocea TaxID=72248 RepID=UPI001E27F8A5|nr:uncharacterized protein LOC123701551 [Colias croceus]